MCPRHYRFSLSFGNGRLCWICCWFNYHIVIEHSQTVPITIQSLETTHTSHSSYLLLESIITWEVKGQGLIEKLVDVLLVCLCEREGMTSNLKINSTNTSSKRIYALSRPIMASHSGNFSFNAGALDNINNGSLVQCSPPPLTWRNKSKMISPHQRPWSKKNWW